MESEEELFRLIRGCNYQGLQIPEYMHESLVHYIARRVPVGDFLQAVIENNLKVAATKADDQNREALAVYPVFLNMWAPSECHGHEFAYQMWLADLKYHGPVVVKHPRYSGPGVAVNLVRTYSQPNRVTDGEPFLLQKHKLMVGVRLENGSVWDYEIETVRGVKHVEGS